MSNKWVEKSSLIGPVQVNEWNEVKLTEDTWKKILDKVKGPDRLETSVASNNVFLRSTKMYILNHTFEFYTDGDFPDLIAKFQIALYRYHNGNESGSSNSTLYDPSSMKLFADRYAPTLFDKILRCMEDNQKRPVSKKRHMKNLQRTVAILHILSYFRQGVFANGMLMYLILYHSVQDSS